MRRRPDLIVPIHDRRKRKRILTLKNFGILVAVLIVAFFAISVASEMRSFAPGAYGRLFRRELPPPSIQSQPMEVVREEPPPAGNTAPIFVEPIERPQPAPPIVSTASIPGETNVAVVGGPEGVTIVRREKRKPELTGGFGR